MAWALQFDGVNDYATIATAINETSTSWRLEWRTALTDNTLNTNRVIAKTSGSTDYIRTRSSSTEQLFMEIDNTTYNIAGGTRSTVDGAMSDYVLTCNGSQLEYFVDGISIGSVAGFPTFKNMELIGRGGSSYFKGSIEYIKYFDTSSGDVLKFNFDATASSHSSGTPVLSELVVGNDATGVNMPTDGSAWIDLGGGGGGLTLVVSSIASGESFGLPDVILNTAYLLPSAITTAESFGVPTVASLDQFIQAISVSSLEAFGEPLILTGGVTLAPTSITSQESLGTPFLVYSQLVLVDSITSEESFGIAIISDGVALVIPVGDRDTYQKIAEYLRATDKFVSYQNNEILLEWLRSEGIDEGSFNDSFKEYWNRKGYVGAYNDRWKSWKGE